MTVASTLPGAEAAAVPDYIGEGSRLMLTAAEAWPEFEDMMLTARSRVTAAFRVFDPCAPLLSDEARAVGDTWYDLIVHTLARGVRIRLSISDFDPVARPELHRCTWAAMRRLYGAAEASGNPHLLDLRAAMHPARAGWPWRLLLTPFARKELRKLARRLQGMGDGKRATFLREAPGTAYLLETDSDGDLHPRRGVIPPFYLCSHHQKLAVSDGERLYIGGLDLDLRRFDNPGHTRAARMTWHDVQLTTSGPAAASAEAHLESFLAETAGLAPVGERPGLLRTLSGARGRFHARLTPRPLVSEIFDRTSAQIAKASRLIYIETQFLRDLHLVRRLVARSREAPDLGLIVVLPAAPDDVAFDDATGPDARLGEYLQTRCLDRLARAFGHRLAIVTPAQTRGIPPDGSRSILHSAPIIYVHAKASVFDEDCAIVSSANCNGRSHRWDTEAGIALTDPETVKRVRRRLMEHWLPEDADAELFDAATAPGAWRRLAEENREAAPAKRRGFLLPYPLSAPRRFGRPYPLLPRDMV